MSICAFIVPTYQKLIATEKTLRSLSEFSSGSKHQFKVILSNNNHDPRITSDIDRIALCHGATVIKPLHHFQSANDHLLWLVENIEIEADWYWLFGDDDFPLLTAQEELDQLMAMKELDYIHATDSKIRLCDHSEFGTLQNLSRKYGVLELFSFWSSQIVSKNLFKSLRHSTACQEIRQVLTNHGHPSAAFGMSVLLLHAGAASEGAVVSSPAVEASHTPSELQNAAGWVWFNLDAHFEFLISQKLLQPKEPRTTFYHHKQPMWMKQLQWLLRPFILGHAKQVTDILQKSLHLLRYVEECDQTSVETLFLQYIVSTLRLNEQNPKDEFKYVLVELYNALSKTISNA